jgi:hypothetical protein
LGLGRVAQKGMHRVVLLEKHRHRPDNALVRRDVGDQPLRRPAAD